MKRPMRTLGIAFAICLVLVLCITVPIALATGDGISFKRQSIPVDSNIKRLVDDSRSQEEIQAAVNRQMEEGYIAVSISSNPVFLNGSAEGNLKISNADNKLPVIVEIFENSSGVLLYKSEAIPVGYGIENAKLLQTLPRGDYKCTAVFNTVNPDNGQYIGKAGVEILITVKN